MYFIKAHKFSYLRWTMETSASTGKTRRPVLMWSWRLWPTGRSWISGIWGHGKLLMIVQFGAVRKEIFNLLLLLWSSMQSLILSVEILRTLIDVIITNNRNSVIHAETSLSIADHHAVSCTINLRKQRMTPFQIYGWNYANYSPENFQIQLL